MKTQDVRRTKVRVGDLVKIVERNDYGHWTRENWIALKVTRRDIARGMNARRPGLYLFSGYWYPRGGVRQTDSYGKILPLQGRVYSHVRTSYGAKRHLK